MSLPSPWIEAIFQQLTVTYGVQFLNQYSGIAPAAVKADWATQLGRYAKSPHAIRFALDHLPLRAPNVLEFRAICNLAPEYLPPSLPAPKQSPERRAEIQAMLRATRRKLVETPTNGITRRRGRGGG